MGRLRSKSGRLKTKERRRRIKANGAQPGEVVLLDSTRRKTKSGARTRNTFSIELHVETQWSVDLDVRKFLKPLAIRVAEHYSDSLLKGQRADGKGPLPALKRDDGSGRSYGVKSGEMAKRWRVNAITGGPFKAKVTLTPYGEGERNAVINRALKRGVDFQTVEGPVAEIIRDEIKVWLDAAVPTSGDGVATPATADTKGGELPQLKRGK